MVVKQKVNVFTATYTDGPYKTMDPPPLKIMLSEISAKPNRREKKKKNMGLYG